MSFLKENGIAAESERRGPWRQQTLIPVNDVVVLMGHLGGTTLSEHAQSLLPTGIE